MDCVFVGAWALERGLCWILAEVHLLPYHMSTLQYCHCVGLVLIKECRCPAPGGGGDKLRLVKIFTAVGRPNLGTAMSDDPHLAVLVSLDQT